MKLARTLLWAVVIFVVALAAALVLLPVYLQSNTAVLDRAATEALGRQVEVGGVALSWSPHSPLSPMLALQNVRVHNPDWTQNALLARVREVDIRFDLSALLARRIEVALVVARDAQIALETGADGRNNWTLGSESRNTENGIDDRVRIRAVQVRHSILSFSPAQGTPQQATVQQLDVTGLYGSRPALAAAIVIDEMPLSVNLTTGIEENPTDTPDPKPWPFSLWLRSGDGELKAEGTTDTPLELKGLTATVQVTWQGAPATPQATDGPLDVQFRLKRSDDSYHLTDIVGTLRSPALKSALTVASGEALFSSAASWSVALAGRLGSEPATLTLGPAAESGQDPVNTGDSPSLKSGGAAPKTAPPDAAAQHTNGISEQSAIPAIALSATLGGSRLSGDLRRARGKRPRFDGALRLEGNDLSRLISEVTLHGNRRSPTGPPPAPKPQPTPQARMRWWDTRLPLDALTRLDLDLDLTADAVSLRRAVLGDLETQVELTDGRLRLERLAVSFLGLNLFGKASLDATAQPPVVALAARAARIDPLKMLHALSSAPPAQGVADASLERVELALKAQGTTPASWVESLDGTLSAARAYVIPSGKQSSKIRLSSLSLSVAADKPVQLKTAVMLHQHSLDIEASGGSLADLLPGRSPWTSIRVGARSTLYGEGLRVDGYLGPLSAVLTGRDVELDLNGSLGKTSGSVSGTLANLRNLDKSQLSVSVSGPDLSALTPLIGIELPAGQAFKAGARIEGHKRRLDLLGIEASGAGSDIAGKLLLYFGSPTRVDATLKAHRLDLTPFLAAPDAGAATVREAAVDLNAPFPLDGLSDFDGMLALAADHVRVGDFTVDSGNLDATLDAGHLVLSAGAFQERLALDLDILPSDTQWRVSLRHKGKVNLAALIDKKAGTARDDAPVDIDLRLTGLGRSVQDLLDSANGRVLIVVGAGKVDKAISPLPMGGVLIALLETLNPGINLRKEAAGLQCAVLAFSVADGIATSHRGLALQTQSLNVLGGGAMKLRTGEIDLHFKTAKRKGIGLNLLGIADKFIYISGTLQHPRAAFNPEGLLIEGGAAWATAGLSLLVDQILSRLTAFGSPCDAVLRARGRR